MNGFVTTSSLSPESVLSGALTSIGHRQMKGSPAIPVPRRREQAAAMETPQADTSGDSNLIQAEQTAMSVEGVGVLNPAADPLKPVANRSIFTRPQRSPAPEPLAGAAQPADNETKLANVSTPVIEAERDDVQKPETIPSQATPTKSIVAAKPAALPKAGETKKPTLNQVRAQAQAKKIEGYDSKIVLNTFRVYSPLVSAVTFAPGKQGEPRQTSDGIRVMRKEVDRLTRHFCDMIGIDPLDHDKQWIVSQFRVVASEHVAVAWKRNPDPETFRVDEYSEAFAELLKNDGVQPDKPDFPDMRESVRVRISTMKSLEATIREFAILENIVAGMKPDFRIDRSALFNECASLLFDEAKRLTDGLDIPDTDPSYLVAFQSMLNRCGEPMAASVMYFSDRLIEKLDAMNGDQREAFFAQCEKDGRLALLDLNELADDFRQSTQALLDISFKVMEMYTKGLKGPSF